MAQTALYPALIERYRKYVVVSDDQDACWGWSSATAGRGYGVLYVAYPGRIEYAHRISWMIENGRIPEEKHVLHRCDNPPCTNPRHLYLGTPSDNAQDREQKGRGVRLQGAQAPRARLSEDQVIEIRRLYRAGGVTQRQLATRFGTDSGSICRIVKGTSWASVTEGLE